MTNSKITLNFLRSFLITIVFTIQANALVKYDEGRIIINGIQLLQDSEDKSAYYYLPDYPRISINENGNFEIMCIKYIGQEGKANGGLFHVLIQFDLPEEVITELEEELQKRVGGAHIVGPVPLRQVLKDGEEGVAGFKIVSSILTNTEGDDAFTSNVITSGHAPLLPGSKAAIAAKLNQEGATLLWESLQGETSDVSVVINGYYEAKVKAYNAIVTAEMSTIYEHFSKLYSFQQSYTKRQLRKIADEMVQNQVLNIEVFDRSKGLGVKTGDMSGILDIITDKLTELMFDSETGWAKQPEKETAVEQGQIKGRQKRGWFSRVFGGARDEKYVTDNQLVIKKREDIKVNKFYLNLSKSTTIKVPVFSSGNIGGLYKTLKEDNGDKYFKIIDLEDVDFLKREIIFQLDGDYVESFNEVLNSVTVTFKKSYDENHNDVTRDIVLKRDDLAKGISYKTISYPRLGIDGQEWLDYEYKLSWNLKGGMPKVQVPKGDKWLKTNEAAVVLNPPFVKKTVQVDADRSIFKETGVNSCTIRFFVILEGKPTPQKMLILRAKDVENTAMVNLYYDKDEPIVYQVTWYKGGKQEQEEAKSLEGDYIFLMPTTE
jgi:hypothetical protein